MSKHTKGPWRAVKNSCFWEIRMDDHRGQQIGDACASQFIDVQNETVEVANAHLMAAAPCLLEALEAALTLLWPSSDEYNAARAAIAKATGEQA